MRNSRDLINFIKDTLVSDQSILVRIDVDSLYTNIKQKNATEAIKWALESRTNLKNTQIEFMLDILQLAMEKQLLLA